MRETRIPCNPQSSLRRTTCSSHIMALAALNATRHDSTATHTRRPAAHATHGRYRPPSGGDGRGASAHAAVEAVVVVVRARRVFQRLGQVLLLLLVLVLVIE